MVFPSNNLHTKLSFGAWNWRVVSKKVSNDSDLEGRNIGSTDKKSDKCRLCSNQSHLMAFPKTTRRDFLIEESELWWTWPDSSFSFVMTLNSFRFLIQESIAKYKGIQAQEDSYLKYLSSWFWWWYRLCVIVYTFHGKDIWIKVGM
jgi:hypothetical protein